MSFNEEELMRIRVLKPIVSSYGSFAPGAVANVPDTVARGWCEAGVAMQDKSLDGAKETKSRRKGGENAI